MTTPIIEHIAANLVTTVNGVTITNGCNQNLSAMRSRRLDFPADEAPVDGIVMIVQGEPSAPVILNAAVIEWIQPFALNAFVIDDDDATASIDTRINKVRSDLEKALLVDHTRGGYAVDTLLEPPTFFPESETATGITINITIRYRTIYADPYTGA